MWLTDKKKKKKGEQSDEFRKSHQFTVMNIFNQKETKAYAIFFYYRFLYIQNLSGCLVSYHDTIWIYHPGLSRRKHLFLAVSNKCILFMIC